MKIKVGGRYVARNGEVVDVLGTGNRTERPFVGSNGFTYTKKGRVVDGCESSVDLLYEFKDHGAQSNTSPLWWLLGIAMLTGLTWLSFNFEKIVLLIEKFN